MREQKWLDLNGKVVIVTGGSQGIGAHAVQDMAVNGAKVVVADLAENEDFKNNENVTFIKCNVTDRENVERVVNETAEKFGKIDALVNNAGVNRPRMLVDYYGKNKKYEMDDNDYEFMMNVNVKGVYLCAQAVTRQMVKQKHGVIVNMASEAGVEGSKGQSCYTATKGAVHAFTKAWAKELGPMNIRVVGVAPGINERTAMNNDETFEALAYTRGQDPNNVSSDYAKVIPLGRAGKLDEVADLISYLVSDYSSYISGTTINITGAKSTR